MWDTAGDLSVANPLDDDSLLKEESRLEKLQYILENTNIDLIGTSMDNTEKRLTYARNFESVKVKKDNDYDKYTLTWNQDLKDKVRANGNGAH